MTSKIRVLPSGLPGRMCGEVTTLLLQSPEQFEVLDCALVGPEIAGARVECAGRSFRAVTPEGREAWAREIESVPPFIAVDYTLPSAIEGNVEFYCQNRIPFVIGTTGGDMAWIRKRVAESETVAVAAPNMAMPIVMLQAAARWVAMNFPAAMTGYRVRIRESHQATKKDTSGTAKALVADFNALGLPFEIDEIEKVRDPDAQRDLGVPQEYLGGHAFHTYSVESPDETVSLSLTHNILGRRVYAEGTLWALRFVGSRLEQGERGRCHDMQDVLRAMADLA